VNASAIDRIARDLRGRMVVHVKGSNDTLLISDSYAHLFRQM
jgi:DNA-binding LytR/AlgR family response regulator